MINAADLIAKFVFALNNLWGYIWGAAGILWTASRQKQKVDYMVQKYGADWEKNADAKKDNYYRAALYGSKWIGHYVADCSGLFAWAFKQLGGAIAHGSNSIYKNYCSAKGKLSSGKRTDGQALKPGTAVFTGTENDHGHIGLYVGEGTVIEASGTEAGVCTSNISASKWTFWGELKAVDYSGAAPSPIPDPTPTPAPEPDKKPTLRRGSKGQYVTLLQTMLLNRGYQLPTFGADGSYGAETESAVKQFQRDWGLSADGVAGPKTWAMLESSPEKQSTYRVVFSGLTESEAKILMEKWPGGTMQKE